MYRLRKITENDLEMVMQWRMSPDVTTFMNTDPVLTLDGQKRWFEKLTSSGEFYFWIVEVNGKPCGTINLANIDHVNKRCEWGYYIAEKSLRSFELAICLETSLYDFVFDILGLNKIMGESFFLNKAAIKMHELCGCKTDGILRQHIFKNGQYYDICVQSILAEDWAKIRNDFDNPRVDFE